MKNPYEAQISYLLQEIARGERMIMRRHDEIVQLRLEIAKSKRQIADLELNTIVTPSVAERR